MAEPTAEASASATAATASTSAPPAPPAAPTVLTTLRTLLRAHVAAHPSPTLPYLHPFAPAPRTAWKGKARAGLPSAEEQVAQLRAVKEAVEGARGVLARGRDDKERVRAARAMREVITHESALLPLGSTLSSLPPAPRPLAAIAPLPPAELLSALGKRLGLQVFAEDSQFGLLKTSLTLAGERFVVDIDLEADADGDDMDEDEGTEPPSLAPTPGLGSSSLVMSSVVEEKDEDKKAVTAVPQPTAERGKVRLAKLSANHVTPSGADGKNEHVARVLRDAVGAHLTAWNSRPCSVKLEGACAALEAALSEIKALDELAAAGAADSADLFADLDTLAAGVVAAVARGEVYEDASARLYPSFRLLSASEGLDNPAIRIRPVARGENVPPAWAADEGMAVDAAEPAAPADEAMVVDGAEAPATNGDATAAPAAPGAAANGTGATPDAMSAGAWLLEVVDNLPTPAAGGRGLIVRRTWLQSDAPSGADDTDANTWIGSIKAEGLLYQFALEAGGADAALPLFPQGSAFVHRPTEGLGQRWSLAQPGPEGYVVGRVGLPRSWSEFGRLVRVLRAQAVLDALFISAFPPSAVEDSDSDGDDLDTDIDLDAPPSALAVTATLHQRSMRISLPLDLSNPESPMLSLELTPSDDAPYVSAAVSGIDDAAQRQRIDDALGPVLSRDAVALVAGIVAALA